MHIFTDCGPHFRSKEFIHRVKKLACEKNMYISLNFFAENHGKSIVDGFFGRLSVMFKSIDHKYSIKDVEDLKLKFEEEVKDNNWERVYFRLYTRNERPQHINKIGLKNIRLYLSYYFTNNNGYYSYLSNQNNNYLRIVEEDTNEVDNRETTLTPQQNTDSRNKRYFNDRIRKLYDSRVE